MATETKCFSLGLVIHIFRKQKVEVPDFSGATEHFYFNRVVCGLDNAGVHRAHSYLIETVAICDGHMEDRIAHGIIAKFVIVYVNFYNRSRGRADQNQVIGMGAN